MKKVFLIAAVAGLFLNVSCRNTEKVQEEDTTSQQVLEGDQTPEQYQGSTGVDEDNNNMVADENIELKKQEFKGSFSSAQTQTYTFTVLKPQSYSFRLSSDNPGVKYMVSHKSGAIIQEATADNKTVNLDQGDYTVVGILDAKDGSKASPDTEFTVFIE